MNRAMRRLLFLLFFASGFCGLVYQVVWVRMAFASFGIITPVLSVVLSVFMLGLALGSWAGGRYIDVWMKRTGCSAALFYASAELLIGMGAFAVPRLFALGVRWLLTSGESDSFGYLLQSALVLAVSVLPWCVCMGATFPLMMAYVRERDHRNQESFSYLYLANVLGAMSGTLLTAVVLVEVLGFHHTLWVAAAGNLGIAAISTGLGLVRKRPASEILSEAGPATTAGAADPGQPPSGRLVRWILFSTGFSAMAMEVVWSRAFTTVLKTQVYSFASIVFAYLGATFLGSLVYRRDLRNRSCHSMATLVSLLAVAAFLPVAANDYRILMMDSNPTRSIDPLSVVILLGSICPLCAVLGYLTPSLIDAYAGGRPDGAGKAYAINVLGCIVGPLAASYVLLPWISERHTLVLLSLPFLVIYLFCLKSLSRLQRALSGVAILAVLSVSLFVSKDFQDQVVAYSKHYEIRRDYAASVISSGEGMSRELLVNGIGMTRLTPVTKFMVHLPLAFHEGPPESALIICFGMGTTYRSALSWDIRTTVVELVPSVKEAFGFYHDDAAQALGNPKGRIVIDDGRRFLMRSREKFDVIVIDPPPPAEAAGCSLLYSEEFYQLAKQHLKPHGILQAWFAEGEPATARAVLQSLRNSFPYVHSFDSLGGLGTHMLGSMEPITARSGAELAARMPPSARQDLLEWSRTTDLSAYIEQVVSHPAALETAVTSSPTARITDDRPYNEYFLLRRWKAAPPSAPDGLK
ncbi:MAG TPA: fused MFS/spermidine synthase [Candidatus Limnocylindrales bacterium]|nr:fused MFS/spermidine synthase [Candidatus Limnocylindrales bacterium]